MRVHENANVVGSPTAITATTVNIHTVRLCIEKLLHMIPDSISDPRTHFVGFQSTTSDASMRRFNHFGGLGVNARGFTDYSGGGFWWVFGRWKVLVSLVGVRIGPTVNQRRRLTTAFSQRVIPLA